MRLSIWAALILVVVAGPAAQGGSTQTTRPAEFLDALTGEWSVVAEAIPGPGQEPVRIESREAARLIGGRWLVAESTGTAGGAPFTSILTLGYDDSEGRFVGSWISGGQAHLWKYTGSLDESGASLTLETEGPVLGNPNKTTRYRDVIEIEGPERKVMRSMILGPDGKWFEFQRAQFRREVAAGPSGEEER